MTSPSPPAPSGAAEAVTAALQVALTAEHAAVYGYSVIGVNLTDPAQRERARALEGSHRATRDALATLLVSRHATPVASASSYTPAVTVNDAATAQRWAVELETGCADGQRAVLGATAAHPDRGMRTRALTGLSTAATQATYWRALLTPDAPTVPFPGL